MDADPGSLRNNQIIKERLNLPLQLQAVTMGAP
ncbi:hypothetical protein JOC37_002137 [Desulfohalotomaculum tongense]|nr:hypothetical protein [Desulforadius tongensis]